MQKVKHTIQRAGRYHAKIRVPAELADQYGGKEFHQKSLKTSDPRTAEKEVRAILAVMDAQREAASAAKAWQALARHLPPDQRSILDKAGGMYGLLRQFDSGKVALRFMEAGAPADAGHTDIEDGPDGRPVKVVTDHVTDPEELQILQAEHRAASAAIRGQTNARGRVLRKLGEDVELEGDVFSLRDLVDDWSPSVDEHTADNARTYVKRFTDLHGEVALSDLTGAHLREFVDAIKGLPKVQSGKRREMTLQQLIDDAKRSDAETIGYATQKKYFDMLKGLMTHAVGRRFIEVDPWAGMKLTKPKVKHSAEKPRRPFTAEETRKILDYVRADNSPQYADSTIDRWAPWIAAYHGLRIQEVCQLRAADFVERDGIWSMQITDEGEGQRVKNRNTVRLVPVHPALIANGLRGVVEARPRDGFAFNQYGRYSKKLEELTPDGRGRVSGEYGKRFGYLLRSKVGISDTRAVFHSFRHRLQDAAENAGIPEAHRRYLTGRANKDAVEGGYGEGAGVRFLLESLAKIDPLSA